MFNALIEVFQKFKDWVSSPSVRNALTEAASLAHTAAPIVAEIAALTPNRTVQQVVAAYTHYGLPLADGFLADPAPTATDIGNQLFNLASTVLIKNHAPTAAVSLANTAVQLAVTVFNASETHPVSTPVLAPA